MIILYCRKGIKDFMSETVLIAILSLGGTLLGSFGGILASNKLVNHRLQELEKKVEKHNNVIERMYKVENKIVQIENEIELRHKND